MVVILNNASFQPVKMHAQFQGCWHQKELVRDPRTYAWLLLTVMKMQEQV